MRGGRLTGPGEGPVHNGVDYSSRHIFDGEGAENKDNGYPYTCNRHVEYADAGDKQGGYYATKHTRAVQDGDLKGMSWPTMSRK